jgi:lipid-A-disaccharide synthase
MDSVVPELLQNDATPERIAQEALDILLNIERRQTMLEQYRQMRQNLGKLGVSDRAAQEILRYLKDSKP